MNDCLGNLNRPYSGRFTSLLFQLLLYLLLILTITACFAPERRVIKNPELNQWNAEKQHLFRSGQSLVGTFHVWSQSNPLGWLAV